MHRFFGLRDVWRNHGMHLLLKRLQRLAVGRIKARPNPRMNFLENGIGLPVQFVAVQAQHIVQLRLKAAQRLLPRGVYPLAEVPHPLRCLIRASQRGFQFSGASIDCLQHFIMLLLRFFLNSRAQFLGALLHALFGFLLRRFYCAQRRAVQILLRRLNFLCYLLAQRFLRLGHGLPGALVEFLQRRLQIFLMRLRRFLPQPRGLFHFARYLFRLLRRCSHASRNFCFHQFGLRAQFRRRFFRLARQSQQRVLRHQ